MRTRGRTEVSRRSLTEACREVGALLRVWEVSVEISKKRAPGGPKRVVTLSTRQGFLLGDHHLEAQQTANYRY